MRTCSRPIALVVVVAAIFVLASAAAPAGAAPGPKQQADTAQRAARIHKAVRGVMNRYGIPGAIVGVWQRGQAPFVKGFGVQEIGSSRKMSPRLYMRLGSETKTFTGTAVLQLVEAGKVKLSDPISKYVDGVPNGDAITVRQLGEMRSGIANFTANPSWVAEFLANPQREWTPQELLANSFSLPPTFPPGKGYEYSNTNYVLLGLLVEAVSREPIEAYIRRHVLAPLKLRHTVFPRGAAFPKPHAHGYTAQTASGEAADATGWNTSWAWAAGAMVSTVHDLRVWAKAVATGTLLRPAIQRQRERFLPIPGLAPARYGFGLFEVNGWIGHNGEVPGYESLTVYLPSRQATLVVLLNDDVNPAGGELSTFLGEAVTRVITPGHVFRFGKLGKKSPTS